MRIAVIIVAMLVVTASSATSSEASQACMTKAEARQQFATVHLYWHGRGHCWDATPAQRHRIGSIKRKTPVREAQRNAVQPRTEQPGWRDSRSEMLADGDPASCPRCPRVLGLKAPGLKPLSLKARGPTGTSRLPLAPHGPVVGSMSSQPRWGARGRNCLCRAASLQRRPQGGAADHAAWPGVHVHRVRADDRDVQNSVRRSDP